MLTRREVIALCLAFVVSLPAVATRLYASDEVEYFAWLRSVVFDRDVDFENEYQHFYDAGVSKSPEFHETFLERTNEVGRRVNYATPGPAFLWSPFFAAGHVVARVTGAPADGFSQPYIAAVAYGSACYGLLAVVLSALVARRVLGGGGLGPGVIVAIGTPLLFYAYLAPGFGHATSAFAVSLFVWIWIRARARWSVQGAIALGLAGGLMGFVREQDVLLVAGPAIDFLAHWRRSRSLPRETAAAARPLIAAVAGTAAFLVAFSPLLLAYYALNGHPGATETATRKMTWTAPHALSVLFSPEHGLFAWTPLALVAMAGLAVLALRGVPASAVAPGANRDARWIASLALVMVAAQAYTSGSVESWTVAGSFGQRRFVALTPLLVLGLAALVAHARTGWPRRGLIALVVLCVWWNLGLMAQFGSHRMDRQRLMLRDNARVTFLELPLEAPGLAWRYLTDRASFYKLPRK
jgi:hypothetical protein